MALRTHFLPLDLPKMRFAWSRKSDDCSCRMALWSHFLLLDQPKMRLFSSGQKKSQAFKWDLKVIFYLLTSPKLDWWVRERDVSRSRQALGAHFLPIEQPNMLLGWIRERDVTLNLFSASWTSQNANWLSKNRCFKGHMALSINFRHVDRPQMRLGRSKKATFLGAR